MSTTAPTTTQAASDAANVLAGLIILAAGAAAIAILILIRGWELRRVAGPLRYPPERSASRPIVLAVIAFCLYLGLQVLAQSVVIFMGHMSDGRIVFPVDFSPAEFAFMVTAPGILAAGLLLLTPLIFQGVGRQLGFAAGCIPPGLGKGLVGSIVAVPLVFCSLLVLDPIYKALHFEHPQAHDLLALMRKTDNSLIRLALIAGAVAVAPLVEEIVFRGFIQSALVRLFSRRGYQVLALSPSPGTPGEGKGGGLGSGEGQGEGIPQLPPDSPPPLPLPVVPLAYEPPPAVVIDPPSVLMRWLAIFLTSAAFASLHPMWMWPPIFLLSLCLGYAYERTGNLWTSITMHFTFNATSTAIYLLSSPGPS